MGFSIVYVPISIVLMKYFHIAANYGIGLMLNDASVFILIVLSVFMGVLSATINAFTGFLTFYIIDFIKNIFPILNIDIKNKGTFIDNITVPIGIFNK